MTTPKISLVRLRQIIQSELAEHTVNETVDHNGIRDIVTIASDLLAAVEDFKENASPAAINAMTPHLGEIEKTLENMVSAPGSYVVVPKKEPQMVSLKPSKKL